VEIKPMAMHKRPNVGISLVAADLIGEGRFIR
jgi:hypothetical protein